MALLGFGSCCYLECVDVPCSSLSLFNLSTKCENPPWKTKFSGIHVKKYSCLRNSRIRCSLTSDSSPPSELNGSGRGSGSSATVADARSAGQSLEDEFSHVTKFSMSDFSISDRVTLGFTSRADEIIFEATLKDRSSPLYNNKVVLRRFTSVQAKRRGRRAIEVLKKLARRRLMYHSYSMHVYGYVCSSTTDDSSSFTLVHGYHGSFSLRHWLQRSDWLPTLEATLALDEESARRVGDDSVGGPTVARQLRLIRILMRDLLIGVNYLHSHGLAHTELRLENLHISPVDRHIKVGLLGNATDLYENDTLISSMDRRKMMIAFDMRCVGFIMAKMVLPELMDSSVFMKFKAFLTKGNDPSCLREFLMRLINKKSALGNAGLQILDRNWGAGWNLLSLLLATKLSERISCLNALRHPFLCGPRWRVDPSLGMVRWSLGSASVRITEEYIYKRQQRSRLAYFVELMEMLNPCSRPMHWLKLFPGKWRLLYWTGKHIGLTFRQPTARVLVRDAYLVCQPSKQNTSFSLVSDIGFTVITGNNWPHNKLGVSGNFQAESLFRLRSGRRLYLKQDDSNNTFPSSMNAQDSVMKNLSGHEWKKIIPIKEFPSSLPVVKLASNDVGMSMSIDEPLSNDVGAAGKIINELRIQIPPEMFDLSKIVCGTYVDPRLLVLRSVNGSALFFTRSCDNETVG